jgi:hypothetical protein
MAQELAISVVQGQLGALEQALALVSQLTAEGLHHTELDRLPRSDINAADRISAGKGRRGGLAAS